MDKAETKSLLEKLTGQVAPIDVAPETMSVLESEHDQLGYSQLNELLLLFGFDRVTSAFFQFLLDGTTDYRKGQGFSSAEQLRSGIDKFRVMAVVAYGNVKFAFKTFSTDVEALDTAIANALPVDGDEVFRSRHDPVWSITPIPPEDAYLTGYMIEAELKRRLAANPSDEEANALEVNRLRVVELSSANQSAYLASDHLDVYVATSMRERHEFASVQRLVSQIFGHQQLADLKLRSFDPTQAYCIDRIDKGLSEGLMLRRAACTIYLAQESDTLGKDSELASTLAQGKPVVAFVPEISEAYVDEHLESLQLANPGKSESEILLTQLHIFESGAAWTDPVVREWCSSPSTADRQILRSRVADRMRIHYDRRARTLKDSHPLGIQVNLATGVANGVLVVRTIEQCAQVVRRIMMRTLEFDLEESDRHIVLREKISGCIFRVVTRNEMLTNAFWNFYIDPAE